ncbi:MAG: hypothetical protein LWW97_06490 [Deltaproteobacteria bacterium]|nr:hypothetical protein [Deltaproteobacteria bacterium]
MSYEINSAFERLAVMLADEHRGSVSISSDRYSRNAMKNASIQMKS